MIRATVLLGVGAAAGIWGTRWARRRLRALTPVGLAGTVAGGLAHSVGQARGEVAGFVADVREAADLRERELLSALGIPGVPELARDGRRSGTIV